MDKMRSDLEFQSLRSSRAFQRSVLRSQGLPIQDSHCFDVVEEAWTAMVKGHIPNARASEPPVVSDGEEEDYDYPTTEDPIFAFNADNEDQHYDYQVQSDWKGTISSTLQMFDLSQQKIEEEEERLAEANRQKLLDWQTYVDQLYYEEAKVDQESA